MPELEEIWKIADYDIEQSHSHKINKEKNVLNEVIRFVSFKKDSIMKPLFFRIFLSKSWLVSLHFSDYFYDIEGFKRNVNGKDDHDKADNKTHCRSDFFKRNGLKFDRRIQHKLTIWSKSRFETLADFNIIR